MFESHLAPASGTSLHRDLSSLDLWEFSLERSRRRRELAAKQRKAAPRTKGTAAAMSAALLVSPVLPAASAVAHSGGGSSSGQQSPSGSATKVGGVLAKRGDVSPTVAEIQRRLAVDDDAIFGPITERAVGRFQDRSGLARTGEVDATTWQALFRAAISFVPEGSAAAKRVVGADASAPPAAKRATKAKGGGQPPRGLDLGSDEPDTTPVRLPPRVPAPKPAQAETAAPGEQCGETIGTPVKGTVTSTFGDGRNHAGIDIAAPTGTAVRAAGCGTVNRAAAEGAYGNIVCIQHSSSLSTCYAHLSKIGTQKGAYVQVGEVIGEVGSTGRSTGPHLHFETRHNGRAQDPEPFLKKARTIPGEPVARSAAPQARSARAASTSVAGGGAQAAPEQSVAFARAPAAAPEPAPAPPAAPAPAPAAAPAPAPAPAAAAAPARAAAAAPAAAPQAAPAPPPQAAPAPVSAPAPEAPPASPAAAAEQAVPAPQAPASTAVPTPRAEAPGIVPAAPDREAPSAADSGAAQQVDAVAEAVESAEGTVAALAD